MNRLIVSLNCEGSGIILLSATENLLHGWKINGAIVSLLSVSKDFKDTNFLQTLSPIVTEKECYFARASISKSSIDICKRVDDIVVKILVIDVTAIADNSLSCIESENVARLLESHLLAAHMELSDQASALSDLRQRSQQILDKYTAAADESAGQRDRLLTAFCQLLNAKKARIAELEQELKEARRRGDKAEGDGGGGVDSDASSGERRQQQKPSQESDSGRGAGGGKRKPPQALAMTTATASTASKPAMRRTRSGAAKKARGSGDNDA